MQQIELIHIRKHGFSAQEHKSFAGLNQRPINPASCVSHSGWLHKPYQERMKAVAPSPTDTQRSTVSGHKGAIQSPGLPATGGPWNSLISRESHLHIMWQRIPQMNWARSTSFGLSWIYFWTISIHWVPSSSRHYGAERQWQSVFSYIYMHVIRTELHQTDTTHKWPPSLCEFKISITWLSVLSSFKLFPDCEVNYWKSDSLSPTPLLSNKNIYWTRQH